MKSPSATIAADVSFEAKHARAQVAVRNLEPDRAAAWDEFVLAASPGVVFPSYGVDARDREDLPLFSEIFVRRAGSTDHWRPPSF